MNVTKRKSLILLEGPGFVSVGVSCTTVAPAQGDGSSSQPSGGLLATCHFLIDPTSITKMTQRLRCFPMWTSKSLFSISSTNTKKVV